MILLTLLAGLSGCESPLRLEGVAQRLNEPIRRSDTFQAATSNGNTIIVVGNQGLVLISNDEGRNWHRSKLPEWPALIDVTACPDGLIAALAIKGQVWTSTDNGSQWQPHAIQTEEAVQSITCDPQNRLWVVGSFSSIFSSGDRGATWKLNSLDEDLILTNIQFLDMNHAVISGEFGTLLTSGNGGETWQRMPQLDDEFYPQAMLFTDPDNGRVVGLGGVVLHTTDGGHTWSKQQSDTIAPLFGIERLGDDLYIVGGEGVLLKLSDERWVRVDHGKSIRQYLRAVLAVGSDKLLVAGQAGALHLLPAGKLTLTASNN